MKVYYFSGSGHSAAVAETLAGMLGCDAVDITVPDYATTAVETAAVVFPVYCQNIPAPAKSFLKRLSAKNVALVATYGKVSFGNVLFEAQSMVAGQVIAGAYIPTGHSFLNGDAVVDVEPLRAVAERMKTPQGATIPRTRKNPLSDFLPAFRSRLGVRIIKLAQCNNCGACEQICPMGAIKNGRTNSKCIRCLRCVTNCPQKALQYKNSWVLNKYLETYTKEDTWLYL